MPKHRGTVTLETERLILRRFVIGDAEAMFRNWASDAQVTKYLTWSAYSDVEETLRVIKMWIEAYGKETEYQWVIVLKKLGEPIGNISVVRRDDGIGSVSVGYCIGRAWWGCGYTTEALRELARFFFEEVGVKRIEARHDTRNPASGRVMEKAGMRLEGILRQSCENQAGLCDCAQYVILAEDYRRL
ncbi:MAG: GNAT family N-acetyltransferase [Clostridium sp.]|jgi:ribosomal-protein-alanine N-acetyltransferase|nr:GNAT family N-acetyltransferase [Clostridium sp.]